MKLMATTLVSLFAVVAFANPAAPAAETKPAAPAATTPSMPAGHDMKKACAGKTGEEAKKCEADMKKAHGH